MNRVFKIRRSHRQCGEDPPTPARNEQRAHGVEEEEPHGHAIDEADAPFIDLESEREMQAYNLMKEREFLHSSAFDPAFLLQIGMDVEFDTIFEHLGWGTVAPVHELQSRLLMIQILGTLQIVDYGITLHCFGRDFDIYWKDPVNRLGFHERCSIDLGFSLGGYQRHAFLAFDLGATHRLKVSWAFCQHPSPHSEASP